MKGQYRRRGQHTRMSAVSECLADGCERQLVARQLRDSLPGVQSTLRVIEKIKRGGVSVMSTVSIESALLGHRSILE